MKKTQKINQLSCEGVPKKRIGKLKTAKDVAKYIARCIRKTEQGGEDNRNYKLVMMASMLLKAIEISSLEDRIEKLEKTFQEKRWNLEQN